ncbi:MAG: family 43 glycosylhydrolase [Phycisphaerae bacterium]|nr:family 43 glycosylhydrolase [Phycisphaerae bacterium]
MIVGFCTSSILVVLSAEPTVGSACRAEGKAMPAYLQRHKLADLILRPTGNEADFDGHAVECPKVFRYGDRWYMAYTGIAKRGGVIHETIGLCESDDLVHWRNRRQILTPGKPGEFDHGGMSGPFTWAEGKRVYTMYCGFPRVGYESRPGLHGLAWTDDLKTWHKSPHNPVHGIGPKGTWSDNIVYQAFVMKHDGQYWMFYNAHGSEDNCEQIGVAISPDLVNWFEYEHNPIIRKGDPKRDRDHVIIADPWVMRLDGKWHLFYFGYDGAHARECLATSDDLLGWTKSPLNPIMDAGPPGSYDDLHCHKPCVIEHDGVFYHFYTPVAKRADGSEYRAIGLATSKRLGGVEYRD